MDSRFRVYWCPSRRGYVVKVGSKTLFTTRVHARAHEYIAMLLPQHFVFYFVFAQPEVREKTRALLHVLDLMPQIRQKIGVLVSYALMDGETLQCVRLLKEHGIQIMLDSGAFHVLERKIPLEQYLSYIDDYINFVNMHIDLFDWVVVPDIPTDARPAETVQQLPNRWKIEKTVENAVYFIERVADPRRVMVVVQGYSPHEYAYCCELYRQHGLVTARVGVGSLCVRKYNREERKLVPEILRTVRECLPSWARLHAFGLNVRFLELDEVRRHLSSSDSGAWTVSYARWSRLNLCRVDGTFFELDLKMTKKDFKFKVDVDKVTIYKYLILSYIEKLRKLRLLG